MTGLDSLFGKKGIFSSKSIDKISKGISKISKFQETLSNFDFKTETNTSTNKELGLFKDFNKTINTLDDVMKETSGETEDFEAQLVSSRRRPGKCRTALLPEAVKDLIVAGEDVDKSAKEETLKNLSMIYADPDGKKLIDKMIENKTKIEIHDPENDKYSKCSSGRYQDFANKIILYEGDQALDSTIHEIGHSVTGQFKTAAANTPENDDNSMTEEIGVQLMSEEMIARMEGKTYTEEKARERAKLIIETYLENGTVSQLDNNFYEHINTLLGIKIQNKFDVKELYNELKAENPNKKFKKLPD